MGASFLARSSRRLAARWLAACGGAVALAGQALAQPTAESLPGDAERPRWEAGVVAGAAHLPDYPGADESHNRGLVAPIIVYRGPVLRVDQQGIRGRLLNNANLEFDITASGAFNARDNRARAGMPDLDYLFGVGPQLVYKGWDAWPGAPRVHLKVTAMGSTNFRHLHGRGFEFDPELRWRFTPAALGAGSTLILSLQSSWASAPLQRYYYQVDPEYATSWRPAYDAKAGYLGSEARVAYNKHLSDTLGWFVAARAMTLAGAANADSPLLRSKTNYGVGVGVVWTPWQSTARASSE